MHSPLDMAAELSTQGYDLGTGLKNFDDEGGAGSNPRLKNFGSELQKLAETQGLHTKTSLRPGVHPAAQAAIGAARRAPERANVVCRRMIGSLDPAADPFGDGRKLLALGGR